MVVNKLIQMDSSISSMANEESSLLTKLYIAMSIN